MAQILTRKQRGEKIASDDIVQFNPQSFFVRSQTGKSGYAVTRIGQGWSCDCPDFRYRGLPCKHIHAVETKYPPVSSCRILWAVGIVGCPNCNGMNSKSFVYIGSGTVQFNCADCRCTYNVKAEQKIEVVRHGRYKGLR